MAERTKLSEERIQLIRRFMGEPENEEDVRSADERPAPAADPPAEVLALKQVSPRPSRPRPIRSARTLRPEAAAAFRHGAEPLLGLVASLRARFELGWPVAAVVLGLLVGLLIARML
jgi:hypothetical protein